jgi:nucleoside-diphosphate-sugar epimerase
MKFTVLGSTGFIGGRLVRHLKGLGAEVETPARDVSDLRGKYLGHVIYAIGLTGDFRTRPNAAIDAHVNVLQRLLHEAEFESWLYLSSTRVYGGLPDGVLATEIEKLPVYPGLNDLYNISKLLGESICLARDCQTVRIARLSNVYGTGQSQDTFLGSVVRDLVRNGKVIIGESPGSSKDYISVESVVETLGSIAMRGRERLYNLASGNAVTHEALADAMRRCGYTVEFSAEAPRRVFPIIDTARIRSEFGNHPRSLLQDLRDFMSEAERTAGTRKGICP